MAIAMSSIAIAIVVFGGPGTPTVDRLRGGPITSLIGFELSSWDARCAGLARTCPYRLGSLRDLPHCVKEPLVSGDFPYVFRKFRPRP